uniref:SFRICE_005926 n=1 Tax=Spodoptera frugiperda TaxID=7108 RepID=A0A2H1VBS2_SPOFR
MCETIGGEYKERRPFDVLRRTFSCPFTNIQVYIHVTPTPETTSCGSQKAFLRTGIEPTTRCTDTGPIVQSSYEDIKQTIPSVGGVFVLARYYRFLRCAGARQPWRPAIMTWRPSHYRSSYSYSNGYSYDYSYSNGSTATATQTLQQRLHKRYSNGYSYSY